MRARASAGRVTAAVTAAVLLALAATSCGSSNRATIRIGIMGDCWESFAPNTPLFMAGAELPFVERGAKPLGSNPLDGVESVTVAGKRVELVSACYFAGSSVSLLAAARRLVEQQGVDVLLTGENEYDDTVLRQYELHQPRVAFISMGLDPSSSDNGPLPNRFHVAPDWRAAFAGLGAYAYRTLGWRTAVTIGSDDFIGWSLQAGFVAEFCSLGGSVVKRVLAPTVTTDWSPYVRQIPPGIDGVAVTGDQGMATFFSSYAKRQPDLPQHVVMSAVQIFQGARPVGVMAGGMLPFVSSIPGWKRYVREFHTAFPGYPVVGTIDDVYAHDAVEQTLEALGHVHGDLSGGERSFMAALGSLHSPTPVGPLRLDRNHHQIGPNFLIRVEKGSMGRLVLQTVAVVPNVDAAFGGNFTPNSPPDSKTQPVCRKGHVPAWAR